MTTRCTDPDDVIAETTTLETLPAQTQWVARCCHGTTSQGNSRMHAVEMALEACAIAHEDNDPPIERACRLERIEAKLDTLLAYLVAVGK
jgi:hypothetical protein